MAFGLLDENYINRHGFRVAKRVPRVQGRGWEETMHIWNLLAVAVLLLSIQAGEQGRPTFSGLGTQSNMFSKTVRSSTSRA